MRTVGDYEKLNVWRKSHVLTCDVYRVTTMLTSRHYWSLGDQMRRAALSVGTNIVEGCGPHGAMKKARAKLAPGRTP